jgi:hypothetical protein
VLQELGYESIVLIVVSVARRFRFMKHRRLLAGLVAAALVIGLFAATATAQSSPDPKTRRNELSDAIEGASAAEAAAIQEVQAATARRQVLEARVAELEREVSGAVQKVEAAEAEVVRITAEIETVQREIERILAEIENLKSRFHESAVAMYKGSGNGSNSVLRLLSTAAGEHQLIAGSKYLRENSQRLESELERQGTSRTSSTPHGAISRTRSQRRGRRNASPPRSATASRSCAPRPMPSASRRGRRSSKSSRSSRASAPGRPSSKPSTARCRPRSRRRSPPA